MARRGRAPYGATYFGRAGECDLVHVRMLYQSVAGGAVAGHDIHDACGKTNLLANFSERQRSQRRKLGGLQNHSVSRRQRRRDFPRQHEQREIPGNNLSHHPARRVTRELLCQQLRPACVVIKMPRHQGNV